jgi:hypothetical protein
MPSFPVVGRGYGLLCTPGEAPRSQEDSIAGLSLAQENGNFLWTGGFNDAGVVGAIEVASAARPGRPVSFGLADVIDLGTAPAAGLRGGAASLPERPVSRAETPGVAPGMETNFLAPYSARLGRPENGELLQALASVRLRGAGQGGHGRETVPQRGNPAEGLSKGQIQQTYGKLPLSFEANVGQADPSVQFLAHGPGFGLYLTGTEAVMVLNQGSGASGQGLGTLGQPDPTQAPLNSIRPDSSILTPDPYFCRAHASSGW